MKELRYTLLSDGSSDEALIPILDWLLHENFVRCPIQSEWAELRWLRNLPKNLSDRIILSLKLYPCDLLFIHRDAEREPLEVRIQQIRSAIENSGKQQLSMPAVCVVPVRMQEAWLLFDEASLRKASGNPHGREHLQLPPIGQLEQISDPKSLLYGLLRIASGLQGHRLKKLRVNKLARRISRFIDDFSPLRVLPAFEALEDQVEQVITEKCWNSI